MIYSPPHPTDRCGQCRELTPLVRALRARGFSDAGIDAWLGGGTHAVRVWFNPHAYALLNLDGFGLYDDARPGVGESDEEGWYQWSAERNDPPSTIATIFTGVFKTRRNHPSYRTRLRPDPIPGDAA